jgi:hypothetical protein
VHRVDGLIGAYRGFDDGTDRRIAEVNGKLADATILQSASASSSTSSSAANCVRLS